jgi:hypothetical protein
MTLAPVEFSESGVPRQIFRIVEEPVGPAYKTFEDAFVNKLNANSHITENILTVRGQEIARWWEVSESIADRGIRGVGQLGHTEQKALLRVRLGPGISLEIRGAYAPCPLNGGCDLAMQAVARTTGGTITYRTYNGSIVHYPRSDF